MSSPTALGIADLYRGCLGRPRQRLAFAGVLLCLWAAVSVPLGPLLSAAVVAGAVAAALGVVALVVWAGR